MQTLARLFPPRCKAVASNIPSPAEGWLVPLVVLPNLMQHSLWMILYPVQTRERPPALISKVLTWIFGQSRDCLLRSWNTLRDQLSATLTFFHLALDVGTFHTGTTTVFADYRFISKFTNLGETNAVECVDLEPHAHLLERYEPPFLFLAFLLRAWYKYRCRLR